MREHGIKRQLTVAYSLQQNGVAPTELMDMVRTMIINSDLSEAYWAAAVRIAANIRNRTTTSILVDKAPFEVRCLYKPTVSHLKTFDANAVKLYKTSSKKFSSNGI